MKAINGLIKAASSCLILVSNLALSAQWEEITTDFEVSTTRPSFDRINRQMNVYVTIKNTSNTTYSSNFRFSAANANLDITNSDFEEGELEVFNLSTASIEPAAEIKLRMSYAITRAQLSYVPVIQQEVEDDIIEEPYTGVSVKVDTTNQHTALGELHDLWAVANRIAPTNGAVVRPGLKVNTVRMLGGINKKVDGQNVPDLDYDLAHYNEELQQYTYNFQPLFDRIDKVIVGGTPIHQLVLDQPPWAFQHGYEFIPTGTNDGIHFRENERVSIYGNSLPPSDQVAYYDYMRALIQALVAEYGESTVMSWRLRIGSEIETPDHWFGTEQDFIEYFANSVNAIRSVLPNATIGLHTRSPEFVYKNGNVKNYKGESIQSFANAIIEYCFDNNIRYDFWGASDYPIITSAKTRDPKDKFRELFEPLVSHPKWLAGTLIDVEEFSVISKIGGGYLIASDTAQADTLMVAMTNEFYKHGVDQVFQWGQRNANDEQFRTKAFSDMVGKTRYQANIVSPNENDSEDIGAIIATNPSDKTIGILLYNYDPKWLEIESTKNLQTSVITDVPAGSTFFYRKKLASKANNKFQMFMEEPGANDYLGPVNGFNKYGNASTVLTEEGKVAFAAYEFNNSSEWSEWITATTLARLDDGEGSIIQIESELPLFSFEKIEVKWTHAKPGELLVGFEEWNTSIATTQNALSGTIENAHASWGIQFRAGSSDGTFGNFPAELGAASSLSTETDSSLHYTGFRSKTVGARAIDFTVTEAKGVDIDLGEFRFDTVTRGGGNTDSWTLEILSGGSLTAGVVASGNIEASWTANYLGDVNVDLTQLADVTLNAGESVTFRLTFVTAGNKNLDLDNVGVTSSGVTEGTIFE
ncbi:MAG: GH39 family glycosyl hydrolase [Thalassotalea sp.]